MSKEVGVMVLGVLTALSPFMGLPGDWRTILVGLLGLGTAALGFSLRSATLSREGEGRNSFFVDNRTTAANSAAHEQNQPPRIQ